MSFAIAGGIAVGASLLATGYSIYSQEQQAKRANQIAQYAADQQSQAMQDEKARQNLASNQQAQFALRNNQMRGVPYDRSGTILSGSSSSLGSIGGIGSQGGGKTILGS
jgi:type II secretory pathway pseudopilin PulG